MKTLLIVEDEKMIRQGIAAMARRSSVSIEEVIECRNGMEALEILKSRPVDVMFTDIRMPKMDGIELVKHTAELEPKPLVVVVSGYDDFNYAVEMMKNGVRDYLLKPIKRDKVEEILKMLDAEVQKTQKNEEKELQSFQTQLRYLFEKQQVREMEWELIERQFQEILKLEEGTPYLLAMSSQPSSLYPCDGSWIAIEEVEGQTVWILKEETGDTKKAGYPPKSAKICNVDGVGISAVHRELREIGAAYKEAFEARKEAFLRCAPCVMWEENCEKTEKSRIPEGFADQFVQQFSTEKMEEAFRRLQNLFFGAKRQPGEYKELISLTELILKSIKDNYARLLPGETRDTMNCRTPLFYSNADSFLEHFGEWLRWLKCCLSEQFDSDRNRDKIQEAIRYIRENYQKDLNMAMVSNHVSMNYSLFSITFKEYTGVNFVNYLKNIRITEAKRLLEETDEKILDISKRVGYENEKHFMKTFKNICGISPSEYRKNMELLSKTKEG